MNCGEFRELISERVAEELAADRAKEFDAHQQVCLECRNMVGSWQQVESLLRASWPSQDPPVPFFLPTAKPNSGWLHTVRNWVSIASLAAVAGSLLLLVLFRPSIQFDHHTLSINFGPTVSRNDLTPVQAVNQAQVQAWVQVAVQQSMAQESARLQLASRGSSDLSREEESRRLTRLGIELEMVKETQASLWQQIQQHGLYLQSAWRRPSEEMVPNQDPGASR